jgi:regulation of enolase protein 1 (concanavalin A-like superfamily)
MRESKSSRREFVRGVVSIGVGAAVAPMLSEASGNQEPKGSGYRWLNEPKQWRREGSSLVCTADPKTDFWRKTFYGYITDNGHAYLRSVTGDFTTTVKISGAFHDLYDQAGFMVRLDESNWMKCGIEIVDEVPHMSEVFTRDYSDWSSFSLGKHTGPLWLKVVRKGAALDIFHSLDGRIWIEDRTGYLTPAPAVDLGLMCAAPEGKGFEAHFDDWEVTPGAAS